MLYRVLAYVVALMLAVVPAAHAQIPSSDLPGRERERFSEQPPAKSKPLGSTLSLTTAIAPPGAAALGVTIVAVRVLGSTIYDSEELASLIGDTSKLASVADIYSLAQKITAKYGNDGFVLSRAIVPPQELDPQHATVTIQIVEGYIDRVVWPEALTGGRGFGSYYSMKITSERPANIKTIGRYLLLAGDLPGSEVSSRFEASVDHPAASTLIVDVRATPLERQVRVDNRGTEPRGPWEFQASATFNNAWHLWESTTFSIAGTTELKELHYAAVDYKQTLNGEGVTISASTNYSWGSPGTAPLEAIEFASKSFALNFGLSVPIVRERERNVTLSATAFLSNDEGDTLGAPSSVDRLRGIRFRADFDRANSSGAIAQGSLVFSQGIEGLGSTTNGNSLASRENGRVDFSNLEGSLSLTKPLAGGFSAFGAVQGQYAFTPLLAPEECGYGGKDIGHAFDPSEITGDSCWSVSGELRANVPAKSLPILDTLQVYASIDYGAVYRLAPAAGTPLAQDGSSAGGGVRLSKGVFNADLSAMKPLSGRDDDGWRFFFSAAARF